MTLDHRTQRLAHGAIGSLLLHFSLPAIVGMLVMALYTVIDRAFLGHVVGADAIGGLSICMPISFAIMAVGMLIGIGSGALVSIRLGQGHKKDAEMILGNAFTMIIVAAILLSTLFLLVLEPLLRAFGATAHTLPYAQQFLRVILLGSFFQFSSFSLNAIIRAEGNPRLAMLTQLINAGLNVILDALFILVLGWGVTGAAVATVLAQAVSAVWTLAHFRSSRSVLRLRWSYMRPHWHIVRPALVLGLAPFAMHLAGSVTSLLFNRTLSRMGGDPAVNTYGVISALAMLVLMPIFGITQGAQPIIGFNFGAGRRARVRRTLLLAIGAASSLGCLFAVVIQTIPNRLINAFSTDPELLSLGTRALRLSTMLLPLVSFQVVAANFFQAVGKAKEALLLGLSRQLFLIPAILVLPQFWGLDGAWLAPPFAEFLATVITGACLAYQWRHLRDLHPHREERTPTPVAAGPIPL